jgi:hypothetical protein
MKASEKESLWKRQKIMAASRLQTHRWVKSGLQP